MLDPTVVSPHFVIAEDQNQNLNANLNKVDNKIDASPNGTDERNIEVAFLESREMEQLIHPHSDECEFDEIRKERAFDLLLWLMNLELRLPPYPAEFQIA